MYFNFCLEILYFRYKLGHIASFKIFNIYNEFNKYAYEIIETLSKVQLFPWNVISSIIKMDMFTKVQ